MKLIFFLSPQCLAQHLAGSGSVLPIWPLSLTATLWKFLNLGEPQFSTCRLKVMVMPASWVVVLKTVAPRSSK